jgi:DNA-directed RNA polymerase specialized sigma24 family protein
MDMSEQSRITAAVAGLTQADQIRLLRIAQRYAFGCSLSAEDLLQEAVARSFTGSREWPEGVGFVPFLAGAMKSIAFDERKKAATHALDIAMSYGGGDDRLEQATSEGVDDEDGAERIELLRSLLNQNENAALVFEYLLDGLKPAQIRAELGLTETEYDSARTYIRRRMNSHFGHRQQP